MSAAATKLCLTEAEFLQQERRAAVKSEYFEGEVFAMAGGTRAHSLIGTNLTSLLSSQCAGGPCLTYNADLRVKVEETGLLTYPDASVVCGPEQFLDDEQDTLLNPTLIAEVLSDSTEAYDRGTKFTHYRLIPSLRHILFVSQWEPRIECYTRRHEHEPWQLFEARGLNAKLDLPGLEISLDLARVYDRVPFDSETPRLRPHR